MSGVIVFSNEKSWFRANWLFRATISRILDQSPGDPVCERLPSPETGELLYLDLSSWSSRDLFDLLRAAARAYRHSEEAGPASFHDPSFYPVFLESFRELLAGVQRLAVSAAASEGRPLSSRRAKKHCRQRV
jgi:hypothetical protein